MENTTNVQGPDPFAWRPTVPKDLDAIVELSQSCYAADGGLGFLFAADVVRSRYLPAEPGAGIGAFAPDGRLAACARVSLHSDPARQRARIVGQVRPDLRGRGLGTALLQWSMEQARSLLAGVAAPHKVLEIATESLSEPAHRLYQKHGFSSVFEELVMRRDLRRPLPENALPQGVTLADWRPDLAEQFYQAYYAAFRERPGFPGYSAARWISDVTEENDHRSDWTLLARSAGEPAGFVLGNMDLTQDPPDGYIGQVGVVPAQRRRGLASALLLESMRRMQASGARAALLCVHLNNPGAIQAYAQLGFQTVGRRARYERLIEI